MTVRIDTGSNNHSSLRDYKWWENFLNQRGNGWDNYAELNDELAKYNAIFVRHRDLDIPNQVEFSSEEDMLMFLMRWA